ncbi:unnamed protein product, partial [Chrysoparadoxa australica]
SFLRSAGGARRERRGRSVLGRTWMRPTVALCLVLCLQVAQALFLDLRPGQRRCIGEELGENTLAKLAFGVRPLASAGYWKITLLFLDASYIANHPPLEGGHNVSSYVIVLIANPNPAQATRGGKEG